MDSFPLMALPFFMLAGEIMNRGGITMRLVEFSQALMGHLRGGLAHVNILSARSSSPGSRARRWPTPRRSASTLIPAMEKNGYTRRFAAAITAASSVIGPIIPPSGIMIIYAYVMGESVAALFLAGIVPGILVGLGLMVMVRLMADRYDLPKAERIVRAGAPISAVESWVSLVLLRANIAGLAAWIASAFAARGRPCRLRRSLVAAHLVLVWLRRRVGHDFRVVVKKAVAPLQTPIIILGGILVGVFTPTEASAIAVAYALLDRVRRAALDDARRPRPTCWCARRWPRPMVLLLVGAAVAFKTVVSLSHAPEMLAGVHPVAVRQPADRCCS